MTATSTAHSSIGQENRARESVGVGMLALLGIAVLIGSVAGLFQPLPTDGAAARSLLADFLLVSLLVCGIDGLVTVRGGDEDAESNRRFGRIAFIAATVASAIALVLLFLLTAYDLREDAERIVWQIAVGLTAGVAVLVVSILIEIVNRATLPGNKVRQQATNQSTPPQPTSEDR